MRGQMMDHPLTLTTFLERARTLFPRREIVTKAGPTLVRCTYADLARRAARLARALDRLGVRRGDRVATFAWNDARHLELYWAVPCMGAVLHPLNLRLGGEQVAWIANHAGDRVLFVDPRLLPALQAVAPHLTSVEHYVVMGETVPEGTKLHPAHAYEDLVKDAPGELPWPRLESRTRPPCATRRGRRGTRRASSTPTARSTSTPAAWR